MKKKLVSIVIIIILLQCFCIFAFAANEIQTNGILNETTNTLTNAIPDELNEQKEQIDEKL